MKNNKGFTSIELLVSFIIVSAIAIGMFDLVLNYRNSQQVASYETTVQSYINNMTKMIQDDLVKRKLASVTLSGSRQATFTFTNPDNKGANTNAVLKINVSDEMCSNCFIEYGPSGQTVKNKIPNIADLTIQKAEIKVDSQFLIVDILFKHPNFENSKRIYITAPINYQTTP